MQARRLQILGKSSPSAMLHLHLIQKICAHYQSREMLKLDFRRELEAAAPEIRSKSRLTPR